MENKLYSVAQFLAFPLFALLCTSPFVDGRRSVSHSKTHDGSEAWGYVEVRPKAHLFWWLYRSPYRVEVLEKPWPIVLWLQGGPGSSGVGMGNFQEIGPLDTKLKRRNSTWLQAADLLFVDSPVGTGYSYVEEQDLVVKTDEEAANDLTKLLISLFNSDLELQRRPLYLVAESYGGRFAVTTAITALKAIELGKLKLILGGVALGNSWISPEDFALSWGPLLKDLSRLDDNGLQRATNIAEKMKQQIREGKYTDAIYSWSSLEDEISRSSNSVDFYNFLLDWSSDPLRSAVADSDSVSVSVSSMKLAFRRSTLPGSGVDMKTFMNGPIRNKLKLIPANVTWGGQADLVFEGLLNDFMKPRIHEVDELLARGVQVTVYNGQVDLICATKGVETWVNKLQWEGLKSFKRLNRTSLYCKDSTVTKAFRKSFNNFHFYWILGAGHFVPVDQPSAALRIIAKITASPAKL